MTPDVYVRIIRLMGKTKKSPQTLGDRIRLCREHRGISREQLAVSAQVCGKTIERLEYNSRTVADTKTLIGISDALDVSIDWLLRGPSAPKRDSFAPSA